MLPASAPTTASPTPLLSKEELARACRFGRINDGSLPSACPSGFRELDRALPIGGWPLGALTEIMPRTEGIGELRLVMPALAKLTGEGRYIAFVEPPHLPYPPALAQQGIALERTLFITQSKTPSSLQNSLWAAEQMLRCSAFGAVLIWAPSIGDKELRRLQLAAEAGKNLALIYRPPAAAQSHSPAALRVCLHGMAQTLCIEIKKCRGGYPSIVRCEIAGPITNQAKQGNTEQDKPGSGDTPFYQQA